MNGIEERCPAIVRLRKGRPAACEIPATVPGRRAWIGVYPLHSHTRLKHEGDYRIRVFEVEDKYLINDNEVWEGVMSLRADSTVFGEQDLIVSVARFADPRLLGQPFDCDYPV